MNWFISPSVFLILLFLIVNIFTVNVTIISAVLVVLILRKIVTHFQQRNQFDIVSGEFKNGFVYSPITGIIENIKVKESNSVISCHSSLYLPTMIGMPLTGEVFELSQVGFSSRSFFERKKFEVSIKAKHLVLKMNVIMTKFQYINNNLRAGDIGQTGAMISIMPAFSTLEIIIPKKYTLNVKVGDRVQFGKTPLATWE